MPGSSSLTSSQRYAAAALLGLALRQAQIDRGRPTLSGHHRLPNEEEALEGGGGSSDRVHFWSHKSHGLLRPIFQFLEIDRKSWPGLEKAAGSSPAKDQAVTFLKIISEEESESSSQRSNEERVLAETVDSMATKLQTAQAELSKKKHGNQYARDSETMHKISEDTTGHSENLEVTNSKTAFKEEEEFNQSKNEYSIMGGVSVNYQRRMTLLFELLSACVADTPQESNGSPQLKKGYDARLRTALRLLATWLDVEWIKVEAMEIMVACSAMALLKEEGAQTDEIESEDSGWSQWKRSGIIGAAALTGGTLMAITGGLAAPAIAAGFSAIAPTIGSLVPVIGSGFAAVASAAGSAAGSVAVAASFGGGPFALDKCHLLP